MAKATDARGSLGLGLMWLGGTYDESDGEWKWDSNGDFVNVEWALGYPATISLAKCLGLNRNSQLQNENCDMRAQFVCE